MLHPLYAPTTYSVLGILLLVGYFLYWTALPRPITGIPYHKDSASRILGDAPGMIKHKQKHGTIFDWMTEQATELNSPIFQLFLKPFSKPAVFITDPREAQDILLRRGKDFDRSQFCEDIFGSTVPCHHIIQPTNEKFRQGRRLLADTMATPFLNNVAAPLLHKHSLSLLELWRVKSNAAADHPFWAGRDLNHFALECIWDVAFGSELRTLREETAFLKTISGFAMPPSQDDSIDLPTPQVNMAANSIQILADGLDLAVKSATPKASQWLLQMTPIYRRAKAYKERLVQQRLDDAKDRLLNSDQEKADDFTGITCATDYMVRRESQAARKEDRAPNYESRQAKDELFGFLLGGFDTTATTLMWATKLLADSSRVQRKLRKALLDTFGEGSGAPTPKQLTTMRIPYVNAVVEEVIRCAQTTATATRKAVRDTQVLGHHIPAGVDVYMMANGPGYIASNELNETISDDVRSTASQQNKHRAVPSWNASDVGVFKPERWIKTDEGGTETFDSYAGPSMQFGAGQRGCFGKKLAYLEIQIMITLLLWTYELLPVSENLRGYEAIDNLLHKPQKCYVILKQLKKAVTAEVEADNSLPS